MTTPLVVLPVPVAGAGVELPVVVCVLVDGADTPVAPLQPATTTTEASAQRRHVRRLERERRFDTVARVATAGMKRIQLDYIAIGRGQPAGLY